MERGNIMKKGDRVRADGEIWTIKRIVTHKDKCGIFVTWVICSRIDSAGCVHELDFYPSEVKAL